MQKTKVVLLSLSAAVAYGIIHDQITARLCIEYFSLAHPPIFPVSSPTLLALCWGVTATFGVGLVLGILLAQASQSPGLPPMPVSTLITPILVLLTTTSVAAAVAGSIGFVLSQRSVISLSELLPYAWVDSLSRPQQDRFLAVWFAHAASYLFGVLGAGLLVLRIWNRRQRPRLLAIFPRTTIQFCRLALVLAIFGTIVWFRWLRAP
jgi:hypothetical protein